MRSYRLAVWLLLVALLWLLHTVVHLDPVRTGLAILLLYGGYSLISGRRTPLVGAVHLMDRDYPLHDISLSCAIVDVKIDLSRAIIPPGEHHITVRGMIGDVTIYVPYDLDVSVVTRRRAFTTKGFADAASKVKIDASLAIGDVDVRCL